MIHKYLGAIHIHTIHSDGTGDVNSISKAAKKAGLDWIIVTDHNSMGIEEGIFNGVYVIKGEELSPPDKSNHYLALGINELLEPSNNPQDNIEKVRINGGFGFAAHPDEQIDRKNPYRPIRWRNKSITPDGVEIWNWFSMWGDNYDARNILTSAYSFLCRNRLVKKPYPETLKWWDDLNLKNAEIVPAIGGIDAHALKINRFIKVFPYEYMFKAIANEIYLKEALSKDFALAKEQILNAIKKGNNIIINRSVCNKPSVEIYLQNGQSRSYCGETAILSDNMLLNVKLPVQAIVNVFMNGVLYCSYGGKELQIDIKQEGKYRVEAEISEKGYIYTNPVSVIKG